MTKQALSVSAWKWVFQYNNTKKNPFHSNKKKTKFIFWFQNCNQVTCSNPQCKRYFLEVTIATLSTFFLLLYIKQLRYISTHNLIGYIEFGCMIKSLKLHFIKTRIEWPHVQTFQRQHCLALGKALCNNFFCVANPGKKQCD